MKTGNLIIPCILGVAGCTSSGEQAAIKPNIIYILADDLGYGDLSCYGQQRFVTPNIDRMASQGMRFTDHYAACGISAPSRCGLMTGVHVGHCTIRENFSNATGKRMDLLPTDTTIATRLKAQGYATAAFGKWGLGTDHSDAVPTRKGFDRFVGFLDQRDAHNHYPPFLHWDEEKVMIPENRDGQTGVYANDIFTEEAKKFIREHRDHPFFIYLPYTIPHAELAVPDDDFKPFRDKFPPETPFVPEPGGSYRYSEQPRASFAGMITRMDRQIGEILELLKELGLDRNTLVMFTSDNGPHRAGGADPIYFNGNAGLRGFKGGLYEGGIRVPFIAWWPGVVEAGSVSSHPCVFYDMMPTLCELVGAPIPDNTDGLSIVPTLLGQAGKQKTHEALFWEFPRPEATLHAVRIGNFKIIRNDVNMPVEVYDLSKDLAEQHDLATKRPDLVKRGAELFQSMRVPNPDFPVPGLD